MKKLLRQKLQGFSLIELSIVLMVMGILIAGAIKGKDLIEAARLRAVVNDVEQFQIAVLEYMNSCDFFTNESDIFKKLYDAGLIDNINFKNPKIGGSYKTMIENNKIKLEISDGNNPSLTRKQVLYLKNKIIELFGDTESKFEIDPAVSENSSQKYKAKIEIA